MKKAFTALALLLSVLLLVACSNTPSEGDIEKQVRSALLADDMGELYEVASVRKLDGRQASEGEYLAEVQYELKFKVGLQEITRQLQQNSKGIGDAFDLLMIVDTLKEQYGTFNAGDVRTIKEEVLFVKSEQGWRIFTI